MQSAIALPMQESFSSSLTRVVKIQEKWVVEMNTVVHYTDRSLSQKKAKPNKSQNPPKNQC